MEVLKRKRGAIRGLITKHVNRIDNLLVSKDLIELEAVVRLLQDKASELESVNNEIQSLFDENDSWEDELQNVEDYNEKIRICQVKVDKVLAGPGNNALVGATSGVMTNVSGLAQTTLVPKVKLPKLQIGKFSGEPEKWQRFWDQFTSAVDQNSTLSEIDKFGYLCSLLSGRAAASIEGLAMTKDNYAIAVKILQERFGNKEKIIRAHMQGLWDLPPRADTVELESFRLLVDNCLTKIRSLEALGVDMSVQGSLLCPVVLRAVPQKINLRWREKVTAGQLGDDLNGLMKFLLNQVENLELTADVTEKPISNTAKFPKTHKSGFSQEQGVATTSALKLEVEAGQEKSKMGCFFCDNPSHRAHECADYKEVSIRKQRISQLGRCFLCLRGKHTAQFCRQRTRCRCCRGKHHHLLCESRKPNQGGLPVQESSVVVAGAQIGVESSKAGTILLQTATIRVRSQSRQLLARCLFDGGSQKTFVRSSLVKRLDLKPRGKENLVIRGFGQVDGQATGCHKVAIWLEERQGQVGLEIEALEVPEIGIIAPSHGLGNWKSHLQQRGLRLADNYDNQGDQPIDILIGADYYWRTVSGRMLRLTDDLVAVESMFGWILQGPLEEASTLLTEVQALHVAIGETPNDNLEKQVRKMWDLDTIGITHQHDIKAALSIEDKTVLDRFEDTIRFNGQRYVVRLPWKDNSAHLTDNRFQAEKRFSQLIYRLRRNKELRTRYSDAMAAYEEAGHAEIVRSQDKSGDHVYYMPHHAIIREERVTTKVRVVFDASSKEPGGLSLNDCLHTGPSLNPEIVALLLRFRRHAVPIVADIEKAFLQVQLASEDRDAVRLLWIKPDWDGKGPAVQVEWRMTRVVFGAGPSPFLLAATIRHHAKKYAEKFPVASKALDQDLFVDDLLTGASSPAAAFTLYQEVKEILGCAGMPLKKWVSASNEVRHLWTDIGESQYPFHKEISNSGAMKVLGMWWDSILDIFQFDPGPLLSFLTKQDRVTKRLVLQASARVFDPLGLVCPILIDVKILFQDLWIRGVDWDENIPEELQQKWGKWMDALPGLAHLKIPRWYEFMPKDGLQFHVFADSSERAYGSVLFVRIEKRGTGDVSTRLVAAKARVAPLKRVSLPRLELLGALAAARLCSYFQQALELTNVPTFFWTDSAIALEWIQSPSAHWKTFVANRVQEIQNLTDPGTWRHCPSAQNPADLVTRGCSAQYLGESKIWWEGPGWLKQGPEDWPTAVKTGNLAQIRSERRQSSVVVLLNVASEELFDLQRFSSWQRVLRITAWVQRAFRHRGQAEVSLTARELSQAATYWIKRAQQFVFGQEISSLRSGQDVTQVSKIYQLSPLLDENGVLRARGRLQFASFSQETRHPVILPSSHRITELIVMQEHTRLMHNGVQATLAGLRTVYWIPRGRQIVKRILRSCPVCRRYHCRPGRQVEAPLPADRISEARPFEISGVDYAGPLFVKVGTQVEKSYVVLFTCAVTRAVHLELVLGMSTEHFILALRRFFSRRGISRILYSDNARTFKRADLELLELSKVIGHPEVTSFCGNQLVTWKYIVERAAWWGGFWERLVRSVKSCLRKILRNSCLQFEEMSTVLVEVEAVVNSRPLTYTYAEFDEGEPLTPSHFLIGGLLTTLPIPGKQGPENVSTAKELTRRWKYRGRLINAFWRRWSREYLMDLRSAWEIKNLDSSNTVKPGTLVLVHEERLPKHRWKLGRVEEVSEGRDGRIRSCMVKVAGGQRLRRPIQLLSPLEL